LSFFHLTSPHPIISSHLTFLRSSSSQGLQHLFSSIFIAVLHHLTIHLTMTGLTRNTLSYLITRVPFPHRSKLAQPIKTVPAAPDARHAMRRHGCESVETLLAYETGRPHCDTIGTPAVLPRSSSSHVCARAGGRSVDQRQHEPALGATPIRQFFITQSHSVPFLAPPSHHPLTYYSPATVFLFSTCAHQNSAKREKRVLPGKGGEI